MVEDPYFQMQPELPSWFGPGFMREPGVVEAGPEVRAGA